MKPKIDKEKCIGCGTCIAINSEVFEFGDDGKSRVKDNVSEDQQALIQQAIDSCPVGAISWEEE